MRTLVAVASVGLILVPLPELLAEPAAAPAQNSATAKKEDQEVPVCKAIKALGENATEKQIGAVVFIFVKQDPNKVMDIVCHAIRCAPPAAAAEIVACAVAATPDPWKSVYYTTGTCEAVAVAESSGDAADRDSKVTLTLVEAIVQAAMSARAGLDLGLLQSAAQGALRGNPDLMLAAVNDVKVIFAVGFAGTVNYGNEPLKKGALDKKRSMTDPPSGPLVPAPLSPPVSF